MKINHVENYSVTLDLPYKVLALVLGPWLVIFGILEERLSWISAENIPLFISAGMLTSVILAIFSFEQETRRTHVAQNDHQKLSLDILKRGALSMELSRCTREALVSLLNKEHAGWSFSTTF